MNTKSHNYGRELKSGILLVILLSSLICISISSSAWAKTYTTSFTATENPISESGKWINGGTVGLDWANVRTDGTKAYGTESGTGGYDDSTAVLTGTWGINQTAQTTVYNAVPGGTGCCQEVELRLRSAISAHSNTGYEVLFSVNSGNPYIQIVKWLGSLGSFAYLTWVNDGGAGANNYAHNGDVIRATITGTTGSDTIIKVYQNGVQIGHAVDNNVGGFSPWTSGNPGMGFYLQTNGSNSTFGLSYFFASDESPTFRHAASCSTANIISAISAASAGEIVVVPSGSCTWSSNIAISKGITLQGAGAANTLINVAVEPAITVTGASGRNIRVAGFEFHGGLGGSSDGAIKVEGPYDWKTFRLDHIKFNAYNGRHIRMGTRGLIDHLQAVSVGWTNVIVPYGGNDSEWSRAVTLGSDDALYVEDSTFTYNSGQPCGITALESYGGARVVLRYSTVTNAAYSGHDYCRSGLRNSMVQEIYNNTFSSATENCMLIGAVGGTGVFFNNTLTGTQAHITLADYKSCGCSQWTGLAVCDGRDTVHDQNTPGQSGWACWDQVGRSTNQSSLPLYSWSNYVNGSLSNGGVRGYCSLETSHIQSGRDYFNNGTTPKPGYTAYTYPHPLQGGGGDTNQKPNPPAIMSIQ